MISGAAQADVAILVVNATRGEFETGFESGGQTREHTMLIRYFKRVRGTFRTDAYCFHCVNYLSVDKCLAWVDEYLVVGRYFNSTESILLIDTPFHRSLGVSQLAVAVNKLDTCAWSQDRFNEIVAALRPFLKQTGFNEQSVWYVPCSGLAGDNLSQRSRTDALIKWYQGPSLLEVIDSMKPPDRAVTRPLRMCVTDVFKGVQSVGVCVAGKIESGSLAQGDKLIVMPAQDTCVVKGS